MNHAHLVGRLRLQVQILKKMLDYCIYPYAISKYMFGMALDSYNYFKPLRLVIDRIQSKIE
jgi:hypothetical protein